MMMVKVGPVVVAFVHFVVAMRRQRLLLFTVNNNIAIAIRRHSH
jgi:hypothetical protein